VRIVFPAIAFGKSKIATSNVREARMGNLELLERAFALAESGEVANIDELRQTLMQDGAAIAELEQFHGRALARQLCGRIARSKRKAAR
jgi:hypothetical protein